MLHVEGLLYDLSMLLLLRELALVKIWTLGLVSYHCNTIYAHFYRSLPCCFFISDYNYLYLLSILHLYHHLFAELVHLYNFPLYWVCWGHKRFPIFGCRVVWERPSSSYAFHGLINLMSSTWGKSATVLENYRLGGPTRLYKKKLCSRHQALFWRRCRGGECLKVYL